MKQAEYYNYMLVNLFRILKKIHFYIRKKKKNPITLNKIKVSPKMRSLKNRYLTGAFKTSTLNIVVN